MNSLVETAGEVEARRRAAVRAVLGERADRPPVGAAAAYAPANVALVKYWGKRDEALHLPETDSLSISLGRLGTDTRIEVAGSDELILNGQPVVREDPAARRLFEFLGLLPTRPAGGFRIVTRNTVPTAAGVASSASAFAALVRALDAVYGWGLSERELSVLARLGSGSACRSLWRGFVRWRRGERADGLDSHGEPLGAEWPELRVGLWRVDEGPKGRGSGEAMAHCRATSPLYRAWPEVVVADLREVEAAIASRDIERLGRAAEGNALAMHAVMWAARPPVRYWTAATLEAVREVEAARREGVPVWFTMDAGPNLKLLYEQRIGATVRARWPQIEEVVP
ncbi:MAG: diphosphomevalonate decarboxylase [Kiritimatiellae bacterium]|nr:diphosphomevalonate decarboxylase [Kiritimatiellia bacterium]